MRDEEGNGGVTMGDGSPVVTVRRLPDAGEVVVVRKWGKRKKNKKEKTEMKRNRKCAFLLLKFTLDLLEFGRK